MRSPEEILRDRRVAEQNKAWLHNQVRKGATVKRHKIGRNAPCPCGSGLKFKKCCIHNGSNRMVEVVNAK